MRIIFALLIFILLPVGILILLNSSSLGPLSLPWYVYFLAELLIIFIVTKILAWIIFKYRDKRIANVDNEQGFMNRRNRIISSSINIPNSSQEMVWNLLMDFEHYGNWRREIAEIKIQGKGLKWTEVYGKSNRMTFDILDAQRDKSINIMGQGNDKSNIELRRQFIIENGHTDNHVKVSINDQVAVKNYHLRLFSFLFFNHKKMLAQFLKDLRRQVGNQLP